MGALAAFLAPDRMGKGIDVAHGITGIEAAQAHDIGLLRISRHTGVIQARGQGLQARKHQLQWQVLALVLVHAHQPPIDLHVDESCRHALPDGGKRNLRIGAVARQRVMPGRVPEQATHIGAGATFAMVGIRKSGA